MAFYCHKTSTKEWVLGHVTVMVTVTVTVDLFSTPPIGFVTHTQGLIVAQDMHYDEYARQYTLSLCNHLSHRFHVKAWNSSMYGVTHAQFKKCHLCSGRQITFSNAEVHSSESWSKHIHLLQLLVIFCKENFFFDDMYALISWSLHAWAFWDLHTHYDYCIHNTWQLLLMQYIYHY